MLKKIIRTIGKIIIFLIAVIVGFLIYFNIPVKKENTDAKLGVTFSARYARDIGLDPKEALTAALDDLHIKKLRIPVYWDETEKEKGVYDFSEIDWQLSEAGTRKAEVILVVGQKVPRWPECYVPGWAKEDDKMRKERLLAFIGKTIERYKENEEIRYWQVENEPFLSFGICPAFEVDLLDREIALVRSLDNRRIIVTDSGELSLWVSAAKRADVFGTTLYRTIWKEGIGYFDYPIGPRFFHFKNWLIGQFAGQDNSIVIELQGEPWISGWTTDGTLSEQFKSMNPEKLEDNISFAKKVGFPEIYVWGVEWWYWLKVKQDHPEMWEIARELFKQ